MVSPISLLYLPTAVGLGALHALEPGHSKTLIAAYLIGTKGTKWDAFLLGTSAAATHSLVVIALSVTALWLGKEVFTDQVSHWLQICSGILVILLGSWMLLRRLAARRRSSQHHPHGAPEPVPITTALAAGLLSIVDTPAGERMRFIASRIQPQVSITISIAREKLEPEILILAQDPLIQDQFSSQVAPAEPHEFTATAFITAADGHVESQDFAMHEPEGHHHGHDHLDDDAHAREHAASMPSYVDQGGRPSAGQVIAFGAAGGMIPCPASITVMLLALSVGRAFFGVLAVLCFSLGLAVSMVGIGMVVVAGFSKLSKDGRFATITRQAPFISACLVIATGVAALALAH